MKSATVFHSHLSLFRVVKNLLQIFTRKYVFERDYSFCDAFLLKTEEVIPFDTLGHYESDDLSPTTTLALKKFGTLTDMGNFGEEDTKMILYASHEDENGSEDETDCENCQYSPNQSVVHEEEMDFAVALRFAGPELNSK